MGYQPTATTATLIAKLTPLGRKLLVTNTNNLITKFALGDSDANYNVTDELATGEVPSMGGDIGPNASTSNSSSGDIAIRYPIYYNNIGDNTKPVDPASISVTNNIEKNGQALNISGSNVTQKIIDINDVATDSNVNLFASFGLPLTESEKTTYTATTFANNGWADTALSGFGSDKIAVIAVDASQYGENLDGREIKLDLVTTAATYTMYSTFQNKGFNLTTEDANYKDQSTSTLGLGLSLGFLGCDTILTPNGGDVSKSWATGFAVNKPFSVGNKELYNLTTNSNLSQTADTMVGVAYLDKGLIVITEPTIVNDFDPAFSGASGTSITFNSISTDVVQNVTCIAGRNEFGQSTNPTWANGDTIRISEIGLYDNSNRLIAYGKFDRQILRTSDTFMSFVIKITV